MKIVKVIGLILVSLVILVLVAGLLLPSKVHVERTVQINAPAEVVFDHVDNLKAWPAWSPWHEMEPTVQYEYSGADRGAGAAVSWTGEKVGSGTQTITSSTRPESIEQALDFGSQGTATASWKFEDQGEQTQVTWGFDSDLGNNPIGKLFGLMMDRWIGSDYERGLANLKRVSEADPKTTAAEPADASADENAAPRDG